MVAFARGGDFLDASEWIDREQSLALRGPKARSEHGMNVVCGTRRKSSVKLRVQAVNLIRAQVLQDAIAELRRDVASQKLLVTL